MNVNLEYPDGPHHIIREYKLPCYNCRIYPCECGEAGSSAASGDGSLRGQWRTRTWRRSQVCAPEAAPANRVHSRLKAEDKSTFPFLGCNTSFRQFLEKVISFQPSVQGGLACELPWVRQLAHTEEQPVCVTADSVRAHSIYSQGAPWPTLASSKGKRKTEPFPS